MSEFSWKDFLYFADYLQGNQQQSFSEEARFRTIINRAFFAAFCYVRDMSEKHFGYKRPSEKIKEKEFLKKFWKRKGENKIADYLAKLQFWRANADYERIFKRRRDLSKQAKEAIEKAREVIAIVDRKSCKK